MGFCAGTRSLSLNYPVAVGEPKGVVRSLPFLRVLPKPSSWRPVLPYKPSACVCTVLPSSQAALSGASPVLEDMQVPGGTLDLACLARVLSLPWGFLLSTVTAAGTRHVRTHQETYIHMLAPGGTTHVLCT